MNAPIRIELQEWIIGAFVVFYYLTDFNQQVYDETFFIRWHVFSKKFVEFINYRWPTHCGSFFGFVACEGISPNFLR